MNWPSGGSIVYIATLSCACAYLQMLVIAVGCLFARAGHEAVRDVHRNAPEPGVSNAEACLVDWYGKMQARQ